jgi:uncharacterized surface protein with fasciclin (FAS1) repeats
MNLPMTVRTGSAAIILGTLSLSLMACGSDNNDEPKASSETTASDTMNAAADTFGPGCKLIPKDGAGSFNGMATAPVATAASANPLLTTLVAAVGAADLGDTLNSADGITVFAPTDDAFAKIPKKTLNAVLKDKATLTKILTHHVVAGQLGPDDLAGEHETLAGDMLTVEGSGEDFTVAGDNAAVLCGNIPTANATVYVVDTVLMPAS